MGFASGVMIAASVWSLLIPAMDMAEAAGSPAWLPAVGGFLAGMGFLLGLDMLIPHLHLNTDKPEGAHSRLNRTAMLALAVALHNLPEGMAVGVVLAGMLGEGRRGIHGGCADAGGGHSDTERAGGRDNIDATAQRVDEPGQGVRL